MRQDPAFDKSVTAAEVVGALGLPPTSLVNRRVPKTLLLENAAFTSGDKKLIREGIESVTWVAALKPAVIGVPEYRDAEREYLEIAVLTLEMREESRPARLIEIIHRAIPYPVLLIADEGSRVSVSCAHKRRSQSEADRMVLDGEVVSAAPADSADAVRTPFLNSLSLASQPRGSLHELYGGWVNVLVAFQSSAVSGRFELPASDEHARRRIEALDEIESIDSEIKRLRAAAKKEKQMNRRVEINLDLGRLRSRREALLQEL